MTENPNYQVFPQELKPKTVLYTFGYWREDHKFFNYVYIGGMIALWFILFSIIATTLMTVGLSKNGAGWTALIVSIGFTLLAKYLLDGVRLSAHESRMSAEALEKESISANYEANSLTSKVTYIYESSINLAAEISEHTKEASLWLKTAEGEYSDNAFSPFWDAIEKVVRHLAAYDKKIGTLSSNAESYYQSLQGRKHTFPSFPVQPVTLPNVSPILNEFRRVIRLGLTNHQFAIIWEHYKDRKVMITGFRHLGEAVSNLGHVIEDSISNLQDSISSDLAKSVEKGIRTREVIADAGKSVDKRLL